MTRNAEQTGRMRKNMGGYAGRLMPEDLWSEHEAFVPIGIQRGGAAGAVVGTLWPLELERSWSDFQWMVGKPDDETRFLADQISEREVRKMCAATSGLPARASVAGHQQDRPESTCGGAHGGVRAGWLVVAAVTTAVAGLAIVVLSAS